MIRIALLCMTVAALAPIAAAETTGTLQARKERRLAELQAVRQEQARLAVIECKLVGALEELEDQTSATLSSGGAKSH